GQRNQRLVSNQGIAVDLGNLASFGIPNRVVEEVLGEKQVKEITPEQAAVGGPNRINVRAANALEFRSSNLVQGRTDLGVENVVFVEGVIPAYHALLARRLHVY